MTPWRSQDRDQDKDQDQDQDKDQDQDQDKGQDKDQDKGQDKDKDQEQDLVTWGWLLKFFFKGVGGCRSWNIHLASTYQPGDVEVGTSILLQHTNWGM